MQPKSPVCIIPVVNVFGKVAVVPHLGVVLCVSALSFGTKLRSRVQVGQPADGQICAWLPCPGPPFRPSFKGYHAECV